MSTPRPLTTAERIAALRSKLDAATEAGERHVAARKQLEGNGRLRVGGEELALSEVQLQINSSGVWSLWCHADGHGVFCIEGESPTLTSHECFRREGLTAIGSSSSNRLEREKDSVGWLDGSQFDAKVVGKRVQLRFRGPLSLCSEAGEVEVAGEFEAECEPHFSDD